MTTKEALLFRRTFAWEIKEIKQRLGEVEQRPGEMTPMRDFAPNGTGARYGDLT